MATHPRVVRVAVLAIGDEGFRRRRPSPQGRRVEDGGRTGEALPRQVAHDALDGGEVANLVVGLMDLDHHPPAIVEHEAEHGADTRSIEQGRGDAGTKVRVDETPQTAAAISGGSAVPKTARSTEGLSHVSMTAPIVAARAAGGCASVALTRGRDLRIAAPSDASGAARPPAPGGRSR